MSNHQHQWDHCNGLPMEAAQERKAIAVRGAFQNDDPVEPGMKAVCYMVENRMSWIEIIQKMNL